MHVEIVHFTFSIALMFILHTHECTGDTHSNREGMIQTYIHNFIKHDDNEQFTHYKYIIIIASCVAYWQEYYRPAQRHFNNNKHNKKYGLALTSHWNKSIAPCL